MLRCLNQMLSRPYLSAYFLFLFGSLYFERVKSIVSSGLQQPLFVGSLLFQGYVSFPHLYGKEKRKVPLALLAFRTFTRAPLWVGVVRPQLRLDGRGGCVVLLRRVALRRGTLAQVCSCLGVGLQP